MKDLTIKCATTAGDSVLFRPLSELVGIRVRDCGRSDEALVDVGHEDARRLRDWLTAWLAEQEGEDAEPLEIGSDVLHASDFDAGVAHGVAIASTAMGHRPSLKLANVEHTLDELRRVAVFSVTETNGGPERARAAMAVHDWLASMVVEDEDD